MRIWYFVCRAYNIVKWVIVEDLRKVNQMSKLQDLKYYRREKNKKLLNLFFLFFFNFYFFGWFRYKLLSTLIYFYLFYIKCRWKRKHVQGFLIKFVVLMSAHLQTVENDTKHESKYIFVLIHFCVEWVPSVCSVNNNFNDMAAVRFARKCKLSSRKSFLRIKLECREHSAKFSVITEYKNDT